MPITLLTGYNGLLGKAVLQRLAKSSEVVCLGRSAPPAQENVLFIHADLAVPGLASKLPARCDRIIHLAQADGFDQFPEQAEHVFAVNVSAVSQLTAWARRAGVRQFVHASTGGLYGTGPTPFRESDPVRIEGRLKHYVGTKYAAEMLASAYSDAFSVTALRYFFIYGPQQRGHMLMPRLIASVREGRSINLAGREGIRINPVHVSDAADATVAAAALEGSSVLNVAGPEVVSLRALGGMISQAVSKEAQFTVDASATPGDLMASIELMSSRLSVPGLGVAKGLSTMCGA
jgi:UDP-glucose 4-epimerase